MLLSKAWELYESEERIEGFSPQTLSSNLSYLSNILTMSILNQ
ncbi:hypothetical protein [Bacillus sp. AFS076308]|nr:hypothetical protein [Bacillus sp. AFS076308]